VINPFLSNGMPTGWDTAAYLAWTNTLRTGGLSYVQSPAFIQYSGLNVLPGLMLLSTVELAQSTLLGYIIFQLVVLVLFFISTLVLSFRLHNSATYAMLSFFILATSFAFLRSSRDLYASLLCVALLQFALVALLDLKNSPRLLPSLALLLATSLMLFTDVEIGAFGIVVLILAATSLTSFKRLPLRKALRLHVPIAAGGLTAVTLWLPFASSYASISTINSVRGGSADWSSTFDELGGPLLIPICIVGIGIILYEWKRGSKNASSSTLAAWLATFGVFFLLVLVLRPGLLYRVALLLPMYLLVSEAMRALYQRYAQTRISVSNWRIPMLIALIGAGAIVSVSSVSTFASQTMAYQTSPYLSQQNFQVLSNLTSVLHSIDFSPSATLCLIYPQQRLSQLQDVSVCTNFYDNWIFATVGPHLTYYGTLENLTANVPINYVSSDERMTYSFYWNLFQRERTISSLNVLIVSFMYAGNHLTLDNLTSPVNGVYGQAVNLRDPLPHGWVPSYYAVTQSGGYFASTNWSYFGHVLESYSPTPVSPRNNFSVTFSLFENADGNYSLDARMMDYDPSNSPIVVSIDNRNLFAFVYYGSLQPQIFSGNVGLLGRGYHTIEFSTLPDMPHNLDLDGIRLSLSQRAMLIAPELMPSDWQVVDGNGNVTENSPNNNLTTVSGTPSSQSGLLGAKNLFSQPKDFSGSKFVVVKINATSNSIILWVTDSNGNVIRYDADNFSPGNTILLVFPIAMYAYSFISSTPPNFSSIDSIELGVSGVNQAKLSFSFPPVNLASEPIPWTIL